MCVCVGVGILFHLAKPYLMRTVLTSRHKWISSLWSGILLSVNIHQYKELLAQFYGQTQVKQILTCVYFVSKYISGFYLLGKILPPPPKFCLLNFKFKWKVVS